MKALIPPRVTAAIVTTLVLVVGGLAAAPAADAAPPTAVAYAASAAEVTVTPTAVHDFVTRTQQETSSWRALADSDLLALRASFERSHYVPSSGYRYSLSSSIGWRVSSTTTAIQIPAAPGQDVEPQSAITVVFDKGNVANVIETALRAVSPDSGTVTVWQDSKLTLSRLVTVAPTTGTVTSQAVAYTSTAKKGDWWGALNRCLANQGIAGWLLAGISIICAAACVITVGLACAICIAAAAGTLTTVVSMCIRYANSHS